MKKPALTKIVLGLTLSMFVWFPDVTASDARPIAQTKSEDQLIVDLEHEWATAAARNDASAYSRILADDFIGNWADGSKTTKKEEVEMLRSQKESYTANEIVEINVRVFGTVAIASGKNTETSVIEGRNATGLYSFTDIFLKRNGHWQLVGSQTARPIPYGSKCGEIPKAADVYGTKSRARSFCRSAR